MIETKGKGDIRFFARPLLCVANAISRLGAEALAAAHINDSTSLRKDDLLQGLAIVLRGLARSRVPHGEQAHDA